MSEDSGAAPPVPRDAGAEPPSTATTLTVDESQRHPPRSPSPQTDASKAGPKTAPWPIYSARSLTPSPAPSERSSAELRYSPDGPEGHRLDAELPAYVGGSSPLQRFWERNRAPILVAVSQLFGALMNLSARLLELEGDGMHPVQVLLLRQSSTSFFCILYMWWTQMEEPILGIKEIRGLLTIRGTAGFFGIYGMWYSMMYLPLADATVITFLAPGVASILCYFILKQPFTKMEQLATGVALLGVVLIAQPATLFSDSSSDGQSTSPEPADGHGTSSLPGAGYEPTVEERLTAVGMSLLGVCGAAGAFTSLRIIGKRAHPLISVNYFGMTCTVICVVVLMVAPLIDFGQPALRWKWPDSSKAWLLLLMLGGMGFIMQYLLTAGLQSDKTNRSNSMVYTHMLFAVSFDRWVFHHEMNLMSFGGCVLILGSAISVVVLRKPPAPKVDDVERQRSGVAALEGERSPMLMSLAANTDDLSLSRL